MNRDRLIFFYHITWSAGPYNCATLMNEDAYLLGQANILFLSSKQKISDKWLLIVPIQQMVIYLSRKYTMVALTHIVWIFSRWDCLFDISSIIVGCGHLVPLMLGGSSNSLQTTQNRNVATKCLYLILMLQMLNKCSIWDNKSVCDYWAFT